MQTGGFGEENENSEITMVDYVKNKYYEKPSFNEMIDFKKPTDYTFDGVMANSKKGFDKFGVYYCAFALILYALFILTSPMFIIPFSTVCITIYLLHTRTHINGYEVTKQHALLGCCVVNGLLFVIFRSYFVNRLVYFFAINALIILLVVIHSQCVNNLDSMAEEEKL